MKLLVDANLAPRVASELRAAGFDAIHVVDLDLVTATDDHRALLVANLHQIAEGLERGAIASLSPTRLAVRDLPIR